MSVIERNFGAIYMYLYLMELLKFMGYKRANINDSEFVVSLKGRLDEDTYNKLAGATEIAQEAKISNDMISDDEYKLLDGIVEDVAKKHYQNGDIIRKLYMKYILVLI